VDVDVTGSDFSVDPSDVDVDVDVLVVVVVHVNKSVNVNTIGFGQADPRLLTVLSNVMYDPPNSKSHISAKNPH
jgi:hypothetical protein